MTVSFCVDTENKRIRKPVKLDFDKFKCDSKSKESVENYLDEDDGRDPYLEELSDEQIVSIVNNHKNTVAEEEIREPPRISSAQEVKNSVNLLKTYCDNQVNLQSQHL